LQFVDDLYVIKKILRKLEFFIWALFNDMVQRPMAFSNVVYFYKDFQGGVKNGTQLITR
jgi:hypothetical protein